MENIMDKMDMIEFIKLVRKVKGFMVKNGIENMLFNRKDLDNACDVGIIVNEEENTCLVTIQI